MEIIIDGIRFRPFHIGDNKYYIGENGDAYSLSYTDKRGLVRRTKKLAKCIDRNGYVHFRIQVNGKQTDVLAHRAVGIAFIQNKQNKPMINHKDGDKKNNHVSNLEWVTRSENARHSFMIGLQCNKGENHPTHKLTEKDVFAIRQIYSTGRISSRELAVIYGLSKTNILDIIHKRIWQHI